MSKARQAIFNNIRSSLQRDALNADATAKLESRFSQHPVHEQPDLSQFDLLERFTEKLTALAGTIESVESLVEVPKAIEVFLKPHNLAPAAVVDKRLLDLPWATGFEVSSRGATGTDKISISQAFAGIAETGTITLLSCAENPVTMNFLPDVHIVVLRKQDLVLHIEQVWAKVREVGAMPRTVNFITGPSRTADIEQTIQLGAHGPRFFHVIVTP